MHFEFIRNIHFTKLVKTRDKVREFNFRLLPNTDRSQFHVDVPDDRGNRIVFKMRKEEGQRWRIADYHLPEWISDYEDRLNDLITEEVN